MTEQPPIGDDRPPDQPGGFPQPPPSGGQLGAYPPQQPGPPGPYPPGPYPPGTPPPQVVYVEKKSNTGVIVAVIVAVALLFLCVPVMAILAVTFLGRAASSKFSSVGSAVRDIHLHGHAASLYLSHLDIRS